MNPRPDQTNRTRVQAAIADLKIVESALAGEFTVEHLIVAEPWDDRFECLKWAVESQATVAEMISWHRAQNGLDLFPAEEPPAATPIPAVSEKLCSCGSPCYINKKGVTEDSCLNCMPF